MHSELLLLTLYTHDHCVSDCPIEMCGRKRQFDLYCGGLRTDCSPADCILIQKYILLFIFLEYKQLRPISNMEEFCYVSQYLEEFSTMRIKLKTEQKIKTLLKK